METAAAALCGRHDFAAFSTGKRKGKSTERTMRRVEITRSGEEVRIAYTADGFLYNMARILTGTLLEIGWGDRPADDINRIFASGRRAEAGFTAPAQGLILWDVQY
jgi:tRNA pseudouridine38-40 synthase